MMEIEHKSIHSGISTGQKKMWQEVLDRLLKEKMTCILGEVSFFQPSSPQLWLQMAKLTGAMNSRSASEG